MERLKYLKKYINDNFLSLGKRTTGLKKKNLNIYNELRGIFKFLEEPSITQMVYHLFNDLYEIPKCSRECCENNVSWGQTEYRKFCSSYCSSNSSHANKKRKLTLIKNYGVDNPLKSTIIKKRLEDNNLKKYGVKNTTQLHSTKEKTKKTLIKKYGVDHFSKTKEFKEKTKKTLIKKYGVDHNFKIKEVKEKIKNNFIEKYGFDNPLKNKKIREKIKKTTYDNYGADSYFKSDIHKEKMKLFYEKHNIENISQIHYNDTQKRLLNDRDWLYKKHLIEEKTLTEISQIVGVNNTTISEYFKKYEIEVKFFNHSYAENEICDFLNELNVEFKRNARDIISPLELDIYLPKYNIAIEYCGLYWHNEINKDRSYHKNKYESCNNKKIRLITIFEDEWVKNKNVIKNFLRNILIKTNSIYARNTEIKALYSIDEINNFFEKTHIQGSTNHSFVLGLIHENKTIAQASFLKKDENTILLNRYSTTVRVIGGLPKIISYINKNTNYKKIITFADLRYSIGNLYEKIGFKKEKIIKEDYFYVKGINRYHKFNFRHSRLKNKFSNYDKYKSEHENCLNNNYYRIYDCGKIKYFMDLN